MPKNVLTVRLLVNIILYVNDNYYHFGRGFPMMTLNNANMNQSYYVESVQLNAATQNRLKALGMTDGTTIKVLNNKRSGSVIFNVRGTRLAVGKKIAEFIFVKEV